MNLERTDPVNWSTLKYASVSPKHYLQVLSEPRADTPALLLGRVTHCALYEPDQMGARYVVEPNFHRGQNDEVAIKNGYEGGKQAAQAWGASLRSGVEVVPKAVFAQAVAMRNAVLADPVAAPLFRGGHSEHRIEWDDPLTGIKCRGRVDHVRSRVSDLKTTRSIEWFERDAARLKYYAQLAWYHDGARLAGLPISELPCIVAVENEKPHDVMVLTFTEEDLDAGRRVYRDALLKLKACRESGVWHGVSGGVARRIRLPEWATRIELDWTGVETEEEECDV